ARGHERRTAHAEAMVKVAMSRLMAARLAGETTEPHGPIETGATRRLADDLKNE
ncbi:IS5/IS1182 family transposase, partial [Kitasatospora phosalacinea]